MRTRLITAATAAAIAAVAAFPAIASANRVDTVTADCTQLVFDMPAGEAGTRVSVWWNGSTDPVHTVTVAQQFDPVRFTVPNRDRSRSSSWTILVDSTTDQRFVVSAPPCPVPSTTVPPAPTTVPSTTTPSTVPTTTVPPSTTVLVPPPPVPTASTVITTPRPSTTVPSSTTPTSSTPALLPATGGRTSGPISLVALAALVTGLAAIAATRRAGGAS